MRLSGFLFLAVAAVIVVVVELVPTTHAALVTSPTFPIVSSQEVPVIINGALTTQHVVTINMNELILQGTIQIDNRSFVITCDPPKWVYSYELTAKVPALVVPHSNEVCSSLDTAGYNASRAAQVERILATPFGYANRRLFFVEGIVALAIAVEALNAANEAKRDFKNFKDNEFEPFRLGVQIFAKNTNDRLAIVDASIGELFEKSNIQGGRIKKVEDNLDGINTQIQALNQLTVALGNDTRNLGQQTEDKMNELRINTAVALSGQAAYLQDSLANAFAAIGGVINTTTTTNQYYSDRIQEVKDSIDRSLALVWDAITQKKAIAAMTKLFYTDLSLIGPGRQAMVGQERLPPSDPDEFTPSDKRLLIEKVYVNYIQRQNTGGPDFGEIVNTEIAFFSDTVYAIENFGPGVGINTIIRRIGPAACNRSFTALDSNGHVLPELGSRNASNATCNLWVEVRTRTCQAKNQAFNWSQVIPHVLPTEQPVVLNPANCTSNIINGLTAREQVFSDYVLFQRWFAATICGATLWTANGQARELQMTWGLLAKTGYIPQPSTPELCYTDLLAQSTTASPYFLMLQGIELGLPEFFPNLIGAQNALVTGQLPAGLQCQLDPVPYMPIRRDANGNLINDGNSVIGGCIHCYWLEASEELVNVYSVAQFGTDPLLTNCQFSAFQKSADLVTDYLVDAGSITARITATTPYTLPVDGLWYGDFDDPSKPMYDVPDSKSSVDGSPYSRKNTVGSMNMKREATVLSTYEEFVQDNGGFWSPFDGAVSLASYKYQRGVASDGYPYCVVGGGIPVNQSIAAYIPSATELAPDAFVAQSVMCQTLKRFRVDKVPRAGTFVLTAAPRVFDMSLVLVMPSGFLSVAVSSFCPTFELHATGGQGYELVLFNARSTAITVVLTLRTNITSEKPFCTKDDTVVVPGAPASVFVYKVPQCVGLNITIQREAVRPEDSAIVLAACAGSPITASSLLSAARAYTGIPSDVSTRITLTDTNTGFVDTQYLYSYLTRLKSQNVEMALLGYNSGAGVFASIEARLRQLALNSFNSSLASLPAFFSNPINLNFTDIDNTNLGLAEILNRTNEVTQAWAAGGGLRQNQSLAEAAINDRIIGLRADFAVLQAQAVEIVTNISLIPVTTVSSISSLFGFSGLEDALVAIVKSPLAAVEGLKFVGQGALGFISSCGDAIKGVLSSVAGIFGTIISAVITIVIVVGILVVLYFLMWKPLKARVEKLEKHNGLPTPGQTAAAAAAASRYGLAPATVAPGDAAAAAAAAAAKTSASPSHTLNINSDTAPLLPPRPSAAAAAQAIKQPPRTAPVSGFARFHFDYPDYYPADDHEN